MNGIFNNDGTYDVSTGRAVHEMHWERGGRLGRRNAHGHTARHRLDRSNEHGFHGIDHRRHDAARPTIDSGPPELTNSRTAILNPAASIW